LLSFVNSIKDYEIDKEKLFEQKDVDQIKTFLDKNELSKYPLEVWANKESKTISQFRYAYKYKKANIELTVTEAKAPISKIEKPSSSKSYLELVSLFTELSGDSFQGLNGDSVSGLTLPFGEFNIDAPLDQDGNAAQ
jgi:hypothetical protein